MTRNPLKTIRLKIGATQAELAMELGIGHDALSRQENGHRALKWRYLYVAVMMARAKKIKITLEELLGE